MEERNGARRVTQRSLDRSEEPASGADPVPPAPAIPPEAPAPEPAPAAGAPERPAHIVLDGPSETQLRKRQSDWLAERARFEAHRRRSLHDEGSK